MNDALIETNQQYINHDYFVRQKVIDMANHKSQTCSQNLQPIRYCTYYIYVTVTIQFGDGVTKSIKIHQ